MFRFEEPAYLYLLLLLPLLAAFYLYSNYRRRKNIRKSVCFLYCWRVHSLVLNWKQ